MYYYYYYYYYYFLIAGPLEYFFGKWPPWVRLKKNVCFFYFHKLFFSFTSFFRI